MYNNDLVGKNKPWGPRSSCLDWQVSIQNRYHKMVNRCENPLNARYKDYGGKGIRCKFTSLSHYYYSLKKQTHVDNYVGADGRVYTLYSFSEFKKNPELYDIDKDIRYGHGSNYTPDTIAIVNKSDNSAESAHNTDHLPGAVNRGRCVIGIEPDGTLHEWYGVSPAARELGVSPETIHAAVRGGRKVHGQWVPKSHVVEARFVSNCPVKGWSFYWKDEYTSLYSSIRR